MRRGVGKLTKSDKCTLAIVIEKQVKTSKFELRVVLECVFLPLDLSNYDNNVLVI